MTFHSFYLDLYIITLVLQLDLDMVKMYLHTQNEVPNVCGSQVITLRHRQINKQTDPTFLVIST